MQVSGYPHFENVCSNILAFLFTTDEDHGFNELFIKSLLEAAGIDTSVQLDNISAEREVATSKNNRIDIVLTNDSIIVGIENKVFSGVNNDLPDYTRHLEELASSGGQRIIKIVLSLYDENTVAQQHGYINITYNMLFERVKQNLGSYLDEANNTWLIYLKDFMNTILSLQGGGNNMNKMFNEFISSNNKEIGSLLWECAELKKELAKKTKALSSLIDLEKYKLEMQFNTWCYNPQIWISSGLIIDITKKSKSILTVEAMISAGGWHIGLYERKQKMSGRKRLETILTEKGVKYSLYSAESIWLVLEKFPHEVSYEALTEAIYRTMNIVKEL